MSELKVQRVVVAGGGTAGWMAAAAFCKVFKKENVEVVLIESESIPPVGVGEATIPLLQTFHHMLEIDDNDFVKKTQGTFKLGIEFNDWGHIGESYIHAFGPVGHDFDSIPFYHLWWKAYSEGYAKDIDEYTINCKAAYNKKFMRSDQSAGDSPLSNISYAYHFDAALYAKYLRNYAEARGLQRIEGKIKDVTQADNGNIASLLLESGQRVDGDFFIDCTGFKALLIGKTLGVPYFDWSDMLPCDSAWAVPCEKIEEPIPYTRATARDAGWQWRIPLQHRTGNGHVYSSQYTSHEDALDLLLENLDGKPLAEPKPIRFTTGKRKEMWAKNCLSLGLASGFMEPLESTSIHLIQSSIIRILNFWPDKQFDQATIDEFNQQADFEFEKIRDFLVLHYHATRRDDTDFWNYVRTMKIPDSLQRKIDIFKANGRIYRDSSEMFNDLSWMEVFYGQGIRPTGVHPLVSHLDDAVLKKRIQHIDQVIASSVNVMPTHQSFIERHCKAEDVYKNPAKAS